MSKLTGIQDQPVTANEHDRLGMYPYAQALTRFIGTCPTPMTVAVQGDWGSGKSSLMLCAQGLLKQEFPTATPFWINTWQLAQFDAGDRLPLIFLGAVIAQMRRQSELASQDFKESAIEFAQKSKRVISRLALGAAIKFTTGQEVSTAADMSFDPLAEMQQLTELFQSLIQRVGNGKPDGRVIFFVDDLDRLQPERAVELLEVMKNFLDVPGAVFVLAIDYEVVIKGLRARFGEEEIEGAEGGDKGRSFFDKIIQVPFKMPVHAFDIARFVQDMAEKTGFSKEAGNHFARFAKAIGIRNPRSIKRAFNTCLLHRQVLELEQAGSARTETTVRAESLTFAVVCLQHEKAALFEKLVAPHTDLAPLLAEAGEIGAALRDFIGTHGRTLDPAGLQIFKSIVKNAELTASGPKFEGSGNRQVDAILGNLDEFAQKIGQWFVQTAQDHGLPVTRTAGKSELRVGDWDISLSFKDGKATLWSPYRQSDSNDEPMTQVLSLPGHEQHLIGPNLPRHARNYRIEIDDGDADAFAFAKQFIAFVTSP